MPPGVNQAISPKLMSPKRLIGLGLVRVLPIGSNKHRGLYLIGSGTALGRMKDWDLSADPESNLISDSPFMSLLCLSSLLVLYIALFMSLRRDCCNALNWDSAYLPRHRFCSHYFAHNSMFLMQPSNFVTSAILCHDESLLWHLYGTCNTLYFKK